MLITMTQEDIEQAGKECTHCPVALAIKRHTNQRWHVSEDAALLIDDKNTWAPGLPRVPLPIDVQTWIARYDADHEVWPITFEFPLEVEQ